MSMMLIILPTISIWCQLRIQHKKINVMHISLKTMMTHMAIPESHF